MDAEGFIHTSKIILYDMFETSIIIARRIPFMRPEDDPRKAPIYPDDISKLREVW